MMSDERVEVIESALTPLISEYNLVHDGTAECGFKNCMKRGLLSLVDYFDKLAAV